MTIKGGAETVAYELAETLKINYEVFVLGIRSVNIEPAFLFDDKINYNSLHIEETRFRSVLLAAWKEIVRYIKKNRIDIVFSVGTAAAFVTVPQMLFCRRTRFIFCDHGALVNELNDKEITMMRRLASLFADKTIVLTERTKKDYINLFHLKKKKVECIPNWISARFLENASNYDVNSKRILSIGRFGKEKGYDLLLKVAENVFEKYPEWKWDIYGEGETFKEISEAIEKLNLKKNIILHGNVADTTLIYGKHALLVLPSYREGLPLVLLEAKANHLPCISFDVNTGPAEIIRDNINGYLIKPYDVDQMAQAICRLIENPNLREKFSEKSSLDIEKFDKKAILKKWVRLIEEK